MAAEIQVKLGHARRSEEFRPADRRRTVNFPGNYDTDSGEKLPGEAQKLSENQFGAKRTGFSP